MNKKFELVAQSEVLPPLRRDLRQILTQIGWNKKTTAEILLAVDEALTNVIRHAYQGTFGKMTVQIEDAPERTEIILEDQGKKFDPTKAPLPELPRQKPGGLGIHFIMTIMDQVFYDENYKEGNRLHLIKLKSKI
ncbi:MAG TPA: ATP-binding protein [Candidatus Omnitrophota bacterium]|nr:ATP-binding protein [Candidatus Omnitrophota bacterium]